MKDKGKRDLERAFDDLEREAPDRLARVIHWLRSPSSRWVRLPLGALFIIGGFLWFLPILGLELLPIGLLLIAQDVLFLRKPVGRGILWLVSKWKELRRWYSARKRRRRDPNRARSSH